MFLKMKPTCDCGHVFPQLKIQNPHYDMHSYTGLVVTPPILYPYRCPKCGLLIEGVLIQLPQENGTFDYDEQQYNQIK